MKQGAKNLTLQRANAVRDALLRPRERKSVTLDANQFATVGNGFMKPNVPGCLLRPGWRHHRQMRAADQG